MDPTTTATATATVSRETVQQAYLACLKKSISQWEHWKISEGLLPQAEEIFVALAEGNIENQEAINSLLTIEEKILRRKRTFYGCNFD